MLRVREFEKLNLAPNRDRWLASIRILKLQTSKYGADINSVMLDYKTSSSNV